MEQPQAAATVGNQFVSQYYTVLHASPRNLYRFYSDASTLTFADIRPDGHHSTKTVTTQKLIHETVLTQGYEEALTEVFSVDSQYSTGGGVVVQVTGALQCKGKARRQFVQTFFLAVQEKGYYVLNDIFRYLPPQPPSYGLDAAAAVPVLVPAQSVAMPPGYTLAAPPPPGVALAAGVLPAQPCTGIAVPLPMPLPVPVPVVPQQQQAQQQVPAAPAATPAPEAGSEAPPPAAPQSYAERLRQAPPAAKPPPPAGEPPAPYGPVPVAGPPASDGRRSVSPPIVDEGLISSVFVRDIPAVVTLEGLCNALEAFGPLRPNGVILKQQRGKESYAFVDFLAPESAQACIRQGLEMEGRRLKPVEKRPLLFVRGGRGGGAPPGRGERGSFRGGRSMRGGYLQPPYLDGRAPYGGGSGGMGMPPSAVMHGMVPPERTGSGGPGRYEGGSGRYDDRGRGRGAGTRQPGAQQQQLQQAPPAAEPAPPAAGSGGES